MKSFFLKVIFWKTYNRKKQAGEDISYYDYVMRDLETKKKNRGEENFETGQDWGYSLGNYNGAQNNNSHKFVHATDAITTMGSDTQPKGHAGMSSAATATAAASVVGTLY